MTIAELLNVSVATHIVIDTETVEYDINYLRPSEECVYSGRQWKLLTKVRLPDHVRMAEVDMFDAYLKDGRPFIYIITKQSKAE